MANHIIIEQIKNLKNILGDNFSSFLELLIAANDHASDDKKFIQARNHFQTVNIKEKGDYIHLIYNKMYVNKNPWDDFLRESRAIVLNWKTEKIILYPFSKFFELDESKESTVSKVLERLKNARSAVYTLKVDGSLITSRFLEDTDEILTVSSGSFDSPHVDSANNLIQSSLWKDVLKKNPNLTFIFEMKLKDMPQNIFYGVDDLILIGARDMSTYDMLSHSDLVELVKDYDLKVVETYELYFMEIVEAIKNHNFPHEGYVLDIDGWKVKLKSTNFVLGSRISTNHLRTFNTLEIALKENRFYSILSMTNIRFKENLSLLNDFVQKFISDRNKYFDSFTSNSDFSSLEKKEQSIYLNNIQNNLANYYFSNVYGPNKGYLSKNEFSFLKDYAKYFNTYAHEKFAETFNIDLDELMLSIENGNLKVSESFTSPKGVVYMINALQLTNKDDLDNVFVDYLKTI